MGSVRAKAGCRPYPGRGRFAGLMLAVVSSVALVGCEREIETSRISVPDDLVRTTLPADAHEAALEAVVPSDYSNGDAWLCGPGEEDACDTAVSVSVIAPDGSLELETFGPNPDAPIDCFYVYPTVSQDASPNSDMVAGDGERNAAINQVARFSEVCRVFAPIYRQVSLAALRGMLAGEAQATDREMAYADVRAAWRHYLEHENDGRGVVLVGHSQGAGVLARLIASEIDGRDEQSRMISALLLGTTVAVDPSTGRNALGSVPLCSEANLVGCVVTYSAFRADRPPPENSLFGRVSEAGWEAACVDPAELDGSSCELKALLPVGRGFESSLEPGPWTNDDPELDSLFVALPGMLSAQCVSEGGFSYLAVEVVGDPEDARVDDIVGDVVLNGEVQTAWGLHIIDVNLAMGNLVDLVRRQSDLYHGVVSDEANVVAATVEEDGQ